MAARAVLAASAALMLSLSGCGGGGSSDRSSGPPTALPMVITTAEPAHNSPADIFVEANDDYCRPWLSRSTCPDGSYRGAVLFFHGYSACATQASEIGRRLNARCLDVFAPNHPGHGIESVTDCSRAGTNCTVRWKGGRLGFNLAEVPHHASQYMDHVKWANDLFEREIAFRAHATGKNVADLHRGVAGLSLGGALATYAVLDRPGLYSHQLLINPFYGLNEGGVDETVRTNPIEREAFMLLEREVLDAMTVGSDVLEGSDTAHVFDKQLSTVVSWDESCPKIFAGGRMGFCIFQWRHAGAMNSFGQHTMARALSTPSSDFPLTQVISTERDGLSRNGYTYSLASHISYGKHDSAMCMYRFREDMNRADPAARANFDNCIPHASLDPLDNPFIDRWWEDGLFDRITSFLSHNATNVDSENWHGTRDECVGMPLGGISMLTHEWMRQSVDPQVAPKSELELHGVPGILPDGSGLEPDRWVSTACHIPLVGRYVVGRAVDCSIFDNHHGERSRPNLSAPPGASGPTRLMYDAAAALTAWLGGKDGSAEERSPAAVRAAAQKHVQDLKGGRGTVEEWLTKNRAEQLAPAAALGLAPLISAASMALGHAEKRTPAAAIAAPADERVKLAEERAAEAEKRAAAAEKREAVAERREKRAEAAEKRAEKLEKLAERREKRAEERERLAEGGAPVEVAEEEAEDEVEEVEDEAEEEAEDEVEEADSLPTEMRERSRENLDDNEHVDAQPSLGELVGRMAAHKGHNVVLKDLAEKLMQSRGSKDVSTDEEEKYSPSIVVETMLRMLKRIAEKLAHRRDFPDAVEEGSSEDAAISSERVAADAHAVEDLMSGHKKPLADLWTLHKDLDGHTLGELAGRLAARNANHAMIENAIDIVTHPSDDVIMA